MSIKEIFSKIPVWTVTFYGVGVFFVIIAGLTGYALYKKKPPPPLPSIATPPSKTYTHTDDVMEKPTGEDKEQQEVFPTEPLLPQIAIIIDDFGWNKNIAQSFLDIDASITFSILPNRANSKYIAEKAHELKKDILLHLPLEPHGYPKNNPGKGALLSTMIPKEIKKQLHENIFSVPHIVGINNHMGSKLSENEPLMRIVMEELKGKDLFFIDSLTSQKSVLYTLAKEVGIATARRSIFLDNKEDLDYISGQLKELSEMAKRTGSAIGIGHPYKKTLLALQKVLPELETNGVEIVPVSELVE